MSSSVNTGLRLRQHHLDRLADIAETLGVSRNAAVGFLIEGAEVVSRPKVTVKLEKNNECSDETLASRHTAPVVS